MTLKGVTLKSGDRAENINPPWICPLPNGHEQVKEVWARLLFQNEDYRRKYLVRHAVGTNSVDSTFQLQPSVRGRSLVWGLVIKRGLVGR